ncbi:hypothetical protein, partial [Sinorhizobium saheli]|uniref:hypothetical protein n=1 Tax=Sinorhizobium saheli TaxID=36856 RepID=UPI001AECA893
ITPCWTSQPWPHNLNQPASGKPGAVQSDYDFPRWDARNSDRGIQIAEVSSPNGTAVPSKTQMPAHAQMIASSLSSNAFNCHDGASRG